MNRKIEPHPAVVEQIPAGRIDEVKQWLESQASARGMKLLLAHADDGVIWGKMTGQGLITSHDAARGRDDAQSVSPPLRSPTLQQARLFADHAEMLLWRDGDNAWRARLIRDAQNGEDTEWDEAFDEPQRLWGTHGSLLAHDFTLLRDGAQGLRHAVPCRLKLSDDEEVEPPRLIVRHYVNKRGFVRVVASRLVGLEVRE